MDSRIIQGDALTSLQTLDNDVIDCIITSPPYYGLRDYGVDGQLGLEETPEEYINKLCDIFDEAKRVLKPTGTCWVNIGDTYSSQRWTGTDAGQPMNKFKDGHRDINPVRITGLPPKCLIGIPFRFALEMINRGWILRNTIIWHKPNCMPSSVKDRFTVDFEYVFFFSRQQKYYFEQQLEPYLTEPNSVRPRMGQGDQTIYNQKRDLMPPIGGKKKAGGQNPTYSGNRPEWKRGYKTKPDTEQPHGPQHHGQDMDYTEGGRNKRAVWKITTKGFSEAHFAVYPPELIEPMVLAGCPLKVCKKCGVPREKIMKRVGGTVSTRKERREMNLTKSKHKQTNYNNSACAEMAMNFRAEFIEDGYTDCGCSAGYEPGVVLDPFLGSGTTAIVAENNHRKWIGIELNEEYVEMAKRRIKKETAQRLLLFE